MPLYKYVAKDKEAKTVTGTVEASGSEELINILRTRGLVIISVSETRPRPKLLSISFIKRRVKLDDIVIFSRQLATMVSAGIPLVNALDILGEQIEKKNFRNIVLRVRDKIETGSSLSEGLEGYVDTFSTLYVNMVKAGESSGSLDEILDRVATYFEKTSTLRKKIKSAMIYPTIIAIMAISVTALLLIKVIPIFKEIYAGFGAGLPLPTQILISVSDFISRYFFFGIGLLFLLFFLISRLARTEKGRLFIDARLLRLPIFGTMIRKVAVGKFTRTFSTLVRSGVSILTCLEIVGKTAGNKVIERAVDGVRTSIREGETIAEPLQKSGAFPPMVVRMVSVGEKTGQLDKMLSKIADFYDEQVEATISGLTSMIEPLIIAFLGIIIGTIVICMFLPIFKISTIIAT